MATPSTTADNSSGGRPCRPPANQRAKPEAAIPTEDPLRLRLAEELDYARRMLTSMGDELASDVVDRGIVMAGGTSLLRNLDRLITQEIGISCYVADNPLECVAMGAGIALDHLELIKRSMPAEGEWLVSF